MLGNRRGYLVAADLHRECGQVDNRYTARHAVVPTGWTVLVESEVVDAARDFAVLVLMAR